jgi:hypothetical protein
LDGNKRKTYGRVGIPGCQLGDATDEENILQRKPISQRTVSHRYTVTSPNVVVAVSAKVTATDPEPPPPPPLPVPNAPVCMAIALRAGTVALKDPPETVTLWTWSAKGYALVALTYPVPVQAPDELLPVMTSQYDPAGRDVVNVAVHAESALLIATNPAEPTRPYHCKQKKSILSNKPTHLVQKQFVTIEAKPSS